MPDRPHVYKAGKIEKLDHWRGRYEKGQKREQALVAVQHALAIHEALIQLIEEVQALRKEVRAMMARMTGNGE